MARKKKYKVSLAEKEILKLFELHNIVAIPQFKIPGVPFIFDFYLPKHNTLVEYNGDYYHCNPRKYKSRTLIKMAGFNEEIIVDYIWFKDEFKAKLAREFGFTVKYVWEMDYKRDGWKAVKKALFSYKPSE